MKKSKRRFISGSVQVTEDLPFLENIYLIPRGVSTTLMWILDEQTVFLDTVDKSVSGQF